MYEYDTHILFDVNALPLETRLSSYAAVTHVLPKKRQLRRQCYNEHEACLFFPKLDQERCDGGEKISTS